MGLELACRPRRLLRHRSYQYLKKGASLGEEKCRGFLKPVPVGFLPAVKPSWGAKASICAGVTDDDDADGVADGAVGVLLIDEGTDGLADGVG
jgi:hypothetical protein